MQLENELPQPLPSHRPSNVERTAALWVAEPLAALAVCFLILTSTPASSLAQSFELGRTQTFRQGSSLVAGNPPESGDLFGFALAAGDFDCDGFDDLAAAAPFETLSIPIVGGVIDIVGAGVVHVYYGTSSGLSSSFFNSQEFEESDVGGISEFADSFGHGLAAGDFNGDTCDDLVIGIPGEDLNGVADAGAFIVVYGASGGLDPSDNQLFHQDQASVLGFAENGDAFGSAFAVGNFDGQGPVDLAVSAPGEGIGNGDTDEGAVWLFEGSGTDLLSGVDRPSWTDFFSQGTVAVADDDEPGDRFGEALTACDLDGDGRDDLIVGVPEEDEELGGGVTIDRSGAVHTFFASIDGIDLDDPRNVLRRGDQAHEQYGFSLAAGRMETAFSCSVIVGRPFRDFVLPALAINGGSIEIWHSQPDIMLDLFLPLDQTALAGGEDPEDDDSFGWTTALGDFTGDGFEDLVVGVWAEDLGASDDGMLHVIAGEGTPLNFLRLESIVQTSLPTPVGVINASSRFGYRLATGDFDGDGFEDLAVGAPYADIAGSTTAASAGVVRILYGVDAIFTDGFESGSTSAWSATVP